MLIKEEEEGRITTRTRVNLVNKLKDETVE